MTCLANSYLSTEERVEELVYGGEGDSKALGFKGAKDPGTELNAKLPSTVKTKSSKPPKPYKPLKLRELPKKLKSVAKRQISIAEGREKKRMKYGKRLEHEHCKNDTTYENPYYYYGKKDEAKYWETIKHSEYFQKLLKEGMKISCSEDLPYAEYRTLHALSSAMYCIIPNNLNIEDFQPLQHMFAWEYQRNLRQEHQCLPHRWCGNKANFFEPLVTRFRRDESGREINIEGLCPYCTPSFNDQVNGYEKYFWPLKTLAYESHLAYHHGVYHTGDEMEPPVFFRKERETMLICHDCKRTRLVDINKQCYGDVYMLKYFAHCSYKHPRRNLIKSRKTQYLLKGQQVERII